MNEIRFALVGAGRRGCHMLEMAVASIEKINPVAVCDIDSSHWYKSMNEQQPLAEKFPDTHFYEDFRKYKREIIFGLTALLLFISIKYGAISLSVL